MSMLGRTLTPALGALVALSFSAGAAYAVPDIEADWQMNEPAGATTMVDSSGNGINAPINQNGLDTGFVVGGATTYRWIFKGPNSLPVAPERVIQISDRPAIEPLSDVFAVEVRFRTKENFGNITQKGQAATRGGQWKIQNPQGRPSCLFKGSIRRVSTRSPIALNDEQFHTLRCVRTASRVELWVDGVLRNTQNGWTGPIDNATPMVIGGKINCDQVNTTCDYFSGQIDYVRLTRGT